MKFLDEIKVFVKSGNGGSGCNSFRREKFVEYGGPDGGNGGKGGDVIIKCSESLNTLIDYRYKPHCIAKDGKPGMKKKKTGKNGEDFIINVPIGTEILMDDKKTLSTIIKAICTSKKKIIFPIHPRTYKRLKEFNLLHKLQTLKMITLLNATGYFEMLELMKKCSFIITDSGGIQEESTASQIRKKTFVVRKTTDRPEAVEYGFSDLIGTNYAKIVHAIKYGDRYRIPKRNSPYGNGYSSKMIISHIRKNI